MKSYKELSRENWGTDLTIPTNEQIKIGAIQRIADATELMAQRYQGIIDDRDRYKRYYENQLEQKEKLSHRIAGLQGYIKRLKKKKG